MLRFFSKDIVPSFLGFVFLFLLFFSFNVSLVLAQTGYDTNLESGGADSVTWAGEAGDFQQGIGLGNKDPRVIVTNLINIALGFLGILAIVIIMYAGFLWMMSSGNPDKIAKAKRVLIGGFIGLVIILSSFAIASFVLDAIFRVTTHTPANGNNNLNNSTGDSCISLCAEDALCIAACLNGGAGANGGDQFPCDGDLTTPSCDADNTLCPPGPNWSCNINSCFCEVVNSGSCYNPVDDMCNYPCRLGLSCYGVSGCEDNLPTTGCGAGDDSCYCCCSPADDQCGLIYPTLSCLADQGDCSGASRGLCCGCEIDYNDGSGAPSCGDNPVITGCGDDACCHSRPAVLAPTVPADGAENVCTNPLISVQFNQGMKADSLADNLLLVGEYSTPCPENTRLLDISDSAILIADNGNNFCAVNGSTRVRNTSEGYHADFIPSNFLDINTVYYIVVRGDVDLFNNIDEGILDYWGVSMDNDGAVSSFRTINDTSETAGVCLIESVNLTPTTYLFKTAVNSVREADGDATDPSFDSDNKDRDKLFIAEATSNRGQAIVSMNGYAWNWILDSTNEAVVMIAWRDNNPDNILNLVDGTGLVWAREDVADGRTRISATVDMSSYLPTIADGGPAGNNVSAEGNGLSDSSDVYVFICNNPWPTVNDDGSWRPWSPIDSSGLANNIYNYDIYYCRDKLPKGTVNDLPAFDSAGVPVDNELDAQILQQVYFSYQSPPAPASIAVPSVPSGGDPNALDIGGVVCLEWGGANTTYSEAVAGYKVYWGTRPGIYPNSEDVGNVTNYCISGLTNERKYYFSVTAYTEDQAESSYYTEVSATTHDLVPPTELVNGLIIGEVTASSIELSWDELDGADDYQISYGFGNLAEGVRVNSDGYTNVIIEYLSPGTEYYFLVRAIDEADNIGPPAIGAVSSVATTTLEN